MKHPSTIYEVYVVTDPEGYARVDGHNHTKVPLDLNLRTTALGEGIVRLTITLSIDLEGELEPDGTGDHGVKLRGDDGDN